MLGLQGFDFGLERFVFGHLAFEEAAGEGGFFGEAGVRKCVNYWNVQECSHEHHDLQRLYGSRRVRRA